MKLKIEITMDSSAFTGNDNPGAEAARILYDYARRIQGGGNIFPGCSQPLRDVNGNEVGNTRTTK